MRSNSEIEGSCDCGLYMSIKILNLTTYVAIYQNLALYMCTVSQESKQMPKTPISSPMASEVPCICVLHRPEISHW